MQLLVQYEATGLASESIVIVIEIYRRGPAWKVRAVGQGYAGGLADLIRDHGVSVDDAGDSAQRRRRLSRRRRRTPPPQAYQPPPQAYQPPYPPTSQPRTAAAGVPPGWCIHRRLRLLRWLARCPLSKVGR